MFTKEQLESKVEIVLTPAQKKMIDDAVDLEVHLIEGSFYYLAYLLSKEFQKTDAPEYKLQSLCKMLSMIYFSNIEYKDINENKKYIKAHNFKEDVLIQKKNIICTVDEALSLSKSPLELYNRVMQGMLNRIDYLMRNFWWEKFEKKYDYNLVEEIYALMKRIIFNLDRNCNHGVGTRDSPKFNASYEVARWIQNDIHNHFNVDGIGFNYAREAPLRVTKQKRIGMKFLKE